MIESLMLFGIGLLAGCLLMLVFFPFVHRRAVRLAKQQAVEATPLVIHEIRADKNRLPAQFAMSVRRLEIGLEKMRAKAVLRQGEFRGQQAEVARLQVELDKTTALILALRAHEKVRKSLVRRIVKIVKYLFVRARRRDRPQQLQLQRYGAWEFNKRANKTEFEASTPPIAPGDLPRRWLAHLAMPEERSRPE